MAFYELRTFILNKFGSNPILSPIFQKFAKTKNFINLNTTGFNSGNITAANQIRLERFEDLAIEKMEQTGDTFLMKI